MFVQSVELNLEYFNSTAKLNIVFGIRDDLMSTFNDKDWTIMNESWPRFKERTNCLIKESDLWDSEVEPSSRRLMNAKLYSLINASDTKIETDDMNQYFWINANKSNELVKKWKQSLRLSLQDIVLNLDYSKTFKTRRNIFNLINLNSLVKNVVDNKVIPFNEIIRNTIHDGYAKEILRLFDEGKYSLINLRC